MLLYGDAVAHINIARRVFDSKTPGLLQLGTVWLPLPHLLIMPFIVSKQMWQTGAGGSIPSMAAFVLGVLGIFRLVRAVLARNGEGNAAAKLGAWAAAIVYCANPNLIYVQSTAMGESLYLALFLWAVAYFAEFAQGEAKALTKCGLCLAAACLTRYDGWFLAALLVVVLLVRFRLSKVGAEAYANIRGFILAKRAGEVRFAGSGRTVLLDGLQRRRLPQSLGVRQRSLFRESNRAEDCNRQPGERKSVGGRLVFLEGGGTECRPSQIGQDACGWHWPCWAVWWRLSAAADGLPWCCGLRCRFTRCQWRMGAFRFSFRSGGRSQTTTCATDCNCYRHSPCSCRWGSPF